MSNLTIPVTFVKGDKLNYSVYIHNDFYVVVTHGNKFGELLGPDGRMHTYKAFCEKLNEQYSDREVVVMACHADTRPSDYIGVNLNPLQSVGEVNQNFFMFLDGDNEGDLLVDYTAA